jgi:hypothetical protein
MTMRKAYAVSRSGFEEDYMEIVFAENRSQAKQQILAMEDWEWVETNARRASYADAYAETGIIPKRVYLENGWWCTCHQCVSEIDITSVGGVDEEENAYCMECAKEKGLTRPEWASSEPEGAGE